MEKARAPQYSFESHCLAKHSIEAGSGNQIAQEETWRRIRLATAGGTPGVLNEFADTTAHGPGEWMKRM